MPRLTEAQYKDFLESDAAMRKRLRNTLEKTFQNEMTQIARRMGYRTHHNPDSRRISPGFLDWVAGSVGQNRLIFVEFKRETQYLSEDQKAWALILLGVAMPPESRVEVYVWRPSDQAEATEILAGKLLDKETMRARMLDEIQGPTRGKPKKKRT